MDIHPEELKKNFKFNPDRYEAMVKTDGLKATLTQLHHDINILELECVEGEGGFNREIWIELPKYRELSQFLWAKYQDPEVTPRPDHIH